MLEKLLLVIMMSVVGLASGGLSVQAFINSWPLTSYPIGALLIGIGSGCISWMTLKNSYLLLRAPGPLTLPDETPR